jgi:hypothetical protein
MKRLIIILTLMLTGSSMAQFGSSGMSDAKTTGMAATYNAVAKGSYAFGINPSNIITDNFRGDLLFILPVPQLNIRTTTSFMNLNDLNYYFGGINGESRYLTEEDVNNFYNKFDDGGDGSFGASATLIAFTFMLPSSAGTVGFSINDVAAGEFYIPQAAIDLPLKGNIINKIYSFNEAGFKSWWIRNYSLTYARELPELKQNIFDKLAAGVSLKLVHGFAYAGTDRAGGHVVTSERSVLTGRADYAAYTSFSQDIGIDYSFDESEPRQSNLQLFPAPAGSGVGVDLGLSAVFQKVWNFSLSVTDIGSINWKRQAAMFIAEGDILLDDLANEAQRDSIVRLLEGDGKYINEFSTGLPLALRMGAAYSLINTGGTAGNLVLAFDYNQGFNDLPGNTTVPRFSIAGDWQPLNWGSVRMGFSVGGIDGFNWAAGLGIAYGVLEINAATTNLLSIPAPNSAKKLSYAVNSRWRFR